MTSEPRIRLYRTRGQDVVWALRSRWFRALAALAVTGVVAGAVWLNWATVSDAYARTVAGWTEHEATPPLAAPTIETERRDAQDAAATELTRLIGVAEGVMEAKRLAGVGEENFATVVGLLGTAHTYIDVDPILVAEVRALIAKLDAAVEALKAVQPPPPPPPPTGGGSPGGSTGGSTGGSPTGGGAPRPVTVSASINCPAPGNVTARASGGGTVTVSISGGASGSNSGSGGASVTVAGPSGAYSATATGTGSVSITSLSCG